MKLEEIKSFGFYAVSPDSGELNRMRQQIAPEQQWKIGKCGFGA